MCCIALYSFCVQSIMWYFEKNVTVKNKYRKTFTHCKNVKNKICQGIIIVKQRSSECTCSVAQ